MSGQSHFDNPIILYTTPDGKSQVSLMSRDGRVWLNQKQMAELFAVSKMNISLHVANILKENELDDSVVKHYFTTAADDARLADAADMLELLKIEQFGKAHLADKPEADMPEAERDKI